MIAIEKLESAPPESGVRGSVHPGGASWSSLYERYSPRIRRQVRRVLGPDNELDDLVQEVLIIVFQKHATLRNPACLDGWVAQVTSNTLKYVMRRRRLRRHASLDSLPYQSIPTTELDVHARDLASRTLDVLERMPLRDRALLLEYWFSPASADSIAVETNTSVPTVRRRLHKARLRFEKLARRDAELARRIDDSRAWSQRLGHAASDGGGKLPPPAPAHAETGRALDWPRPARGRGAVAEIQSYAGY